MLELVRSKGRGVFPPMMRIFLLLLLVVCSVCDAAPTFGSFLRAEIVASNNPNLVFTYEGGNNLKAALTWKAYGTVVYPFTQLAR